MIKKTQQVDFVLAKYIIYIQCFVHRICKIYNIYYYIGNFAHPEDIQLFLNVLNGSMALHAGDSVILRDVIPSFNLQT